MRDKKRMYVSLEKAHDKVNREALGHVLRTYKREEEGQG